jgi:type II secretory pathway component PulC
LLPRNKAKDAPATPAVNPAPATPGVGDTPAETRREGREQAREVRDATRDAGQPRAEAREAARETRQETRQNIQAMRAADLGVWFSTQGNNQGLVIDDLTDKGVFADAGFREGDTIVSIAGQPVMTEAQFVQFLTARNLTGPVQVIVLRGGQRQTLVLQPAALTQSVVTYDPFYQYGIVVDDSRPNQIVIQRVFPRTPAYYAGLRVGDVITTIGGRPITTIDAFSRALVAGDARINLGITRSGAQRQILLDGSSISVDGSARTALRPNLDAELRGDAKADARIDSKATPGSRTEPNTPQAAPAERPGAGAGTRVNPPAGTTPATPVPPAIPTTPGLPKTPATPATPAVPATPATPAIPATPPASGTTPALPATPATPAVPAVPKLP